MSQDIILEADMDYETDCSNEPLDALESQAESSSAAQIEADQQRSEAYKWARAFEAAFTSGNFAEAARLAGERNLLSSQAGTVTQS